MLSNFSSSCYALLIDDKLQEYSQKLKQLHAEDLGSGCSAKKYTLTYEEAF